MAVSLAIPAALKGVGAGIKGVGAGIKSLSLIQKLLLAFFGTTTALDYLETRGGLGVERAKVGLGGRQMELAAAVGKKEEARTEKLMRRLFREEEKRYLRGEKAETRADIRASQEKQNQMAMAMLMALSNLQRQQAEIASRPAPSTASMLSLMR